MLQSQTGLGDAMGAARLQFGTATSDVGRSQASLKYGDMLTKYGAEVPEGMRGTMIKGLAEQLRRDFETAGVAAPTDGFDKLAEKQINNRFKTEKNIDTLIAKIWKISEHGLRTPKGK